MLMSRVDAPRPAGMGAMRRETRPEGLTGVEGGVPRHQLALEASRLGECLQLLQLLPPQVDMRSSTPEKRREPEPVSPASG
jgi:hypothetical protein